MDNVANENLHKIIHDITVLNKAADQRIFSRYGLRSVRFFVLMNLYEGQGLTLGELSDRALIGLASASRMIFSMEKDGLVIRTPDPDDRRSFTLTLAPKGEALYRQVKADLDIDIAQRFLSFDDKAIAHIEKTNEGLKNALEAHLQSKRMK